MDFLIKMAVVELIEMLPHLYLAFDKLFYKKIMLQKSAFFHSFSPATVAKWQHNFACFYTFAAVLWRRNATDGFRFHQNPVSKVVRLSLFQRKYARTCAKYTGFFPTPQFYFVLQIMPIKLALYGCHKGVSANLTNEGILGFSQQKYF